MLRSHRAGTAGAILVCALSTAAPAYAWKPNTHVYLAERAMVDATDGSITLKSLSYATPLNGAEDDLGTFLTNDLSRRALAAFPGAFRAGVLGPDAYPDLMSGQAVIHPEDDDHGGGSDAWLQYIHREALATNDLEIIAFSLGFLAHAAGDMYGHTMVNQYAGGPWQLIPLDNAVTHMLVEGYIGKKTPAPLSFDAAISPNVERFIYRTMVDVTEGTHARSLYAEKSGGAATVPWIFSTLRDALSAFVQSYRDERAYLSWQAGHAPILERPFWAAALGGYVSLVGPLVLYSEAWISDIDRGLQAWPRASGQVAVALMFSPSTGCDNGGASAALDAFWDDYMKSMLGVPDIVVSIGNFVSDMLAVVPFDPIGYLEHRILDFLINGITGKTPAEWCDLSTHPENYLDNNSLASLDQALAITPAAPQLRYNLMPAAMNTVTMIKLSLMGTVGLHSVLDKLGFPVAVADAVIAAVPQENAMLGFMKSLDGSNQWVENSNAMLLHTDCDAYQQLFAKQIGESYNNTATSYQFNRAGAPARCSRVTALSVAPLPRYPTTPYCGPGANATVTLDGPVGPSGGRVRVIGDGVIGYPAQDPVAHYTWVAPNQSQQTFSVAVMPTLAPRTASLRVGRQQTSATGTLNIGPASMQSFRVEEASWENLTHDRWLADDQAVRAGSRLTAEITTDCDNVVATEPMRVILCPQGSNVCTELARANAQPRLRIPFAIPPTTADGYYVLRGSYGNTHIDLPLFIIATRIARVSFAPAEVLLSGISTTQVTATIELNSPAGAGGERISLSYYRGISGPASVRVPAGARQASVAVTAPRSPIAPCEGEFAVLVALSDVDAARALPPVLPPEVGTVALHPRSQQGYLGMEYAGATVAACLDWRSIINTNMRLEMMMEMLGIAFDRIDPRPVYPQEVVHDRY